MNRYYKLSELVKFLDDEIEDLLYMQTEKWIPSEVNRLNANIEYYAMVRFNLKNCLEDYFSEDRLKTIMYASIHDCAEYIYPDFFDAIDDAYKTMMVILFS